MSDICTCMPVDGYLVRRLDGCPKHGPALPRTIPEPRVAEMAENEVDMACAWSDYRKDYGVSQDHMTAARKAFLAGWKAAREGDQAGVVR